MCLVKECNFLIFKVTQVHTQIALYPNLNDCLFYLKPNPFRYQIFKKNEIFGPLFFICSTAVFFLKHETVWFTVYASLFSRRFSVSFVSYKSKQIALQENLNDCLFDLKPNLFRYLIFKQREIFRATFLNIIVPQLHFSRYI